MLSSLEIIKKQPELQRDFTINEFPDPIIEFWDFFEVNSRFTLLRYEHVIDGIRAIYCE
ncbi:hypothetical protein F889_01925 [Acinetobacter colistiniresistens]|uniref:Uncharacterized protein n=1 Tax=Acinetobacter colistiniresistens TaxID=280145 RepID=N9R666_9GAMM|nr:hypothetical protein [Acinetobacter colistiniresistens]ENX34637.1 hypothetical protein F889_01925 [Acinetobacter colistiniresistens]